MNLTIFKISQDELEESEILYDTIEETKIYNLKKSEKLFDNVKTVLTCTNTTHCNFKDIMNFIILKNIKLIL